jgi:hypothetical protein
MDTKASIKLRCPLPIAKLYEAMDLESELRQRVRKLVDLFERTSQYLVLVGLATYRHAGLLDPKVEALRPGLTRPSLGHWVGLLKTLSQALRPHDLKFLTEEPDHMYKDDFISAAVHTLAQITGVKSPKRVGLHHFLDTMVEFRNRKIGHGMLSHFEAKQVSQPLEDALIQWL